MAAVGESLQSTAGKWAKFRSEHAESVPHQVHPVTSSAVLESPSGPAPVAHTTHLCDPHGPTGWLPRQ
jgi:hypothetical protein